MRAVIFILCLLLTASKMSATSIDTVHSKVEIHRVTETYTSETILFNDTNGNTTAAFHTKVVVRMFARENYIQLIVEEGEPFQGVYLIANYKEQYINGKLLREWSVVDQNVGIVIQDEEMNIYFLRYTGEMMIIPDAQRVP